MNNRSGVLAAAALAMWSFAGSARAETFDFSYTFNDGGVVTGVLEGTVQPDMNTVLTSIVDSLVVFGETVTPPLFVTLHAYNPPPAIVTFDGSFMDIVVANTDRTAAFSASSDDGRVGGATPSGSVDYETYDPAQWTLTAVPEPATWALMLAGFVGLGVLARGRKRSSETRMSRLRLVPSVRAFSLQR
jgi:PEP-CTERM motif